MGLDYFQVVGDPEAPIPLSVETMKHLRAVMETGCPSFGDDLRGYNCFHCDKPYSSFDLASHSPDCPWKAAKAFLDGIDKPS